MEAIATGAAANVISALFVDVVRLLNDLIRSAEYVEEMRSELQTLKISIEELQSRVNAQQARSIPKPVEEWLTKATDTLHTAQRILDDYQRYRCHPRWIRWITSVGFRPKLNKRIRHWKAHLQQLLQQGKSSFDLISTAQQVLSTALEHAGPLLQPVPPSGYVGAAMQSAQSTVESWLIGGDGSIRVIGVYGAGGIGKTSLLNMIHNSDKVRRAFQLVIWTTVSREFSIADIQSRIANKVGLQLPEPVDMDFRKMKLHEALGRRSFLLILDDMWRRVDLEEVGVPSGKMDSKILLSSRDKAVCRSMAANRTWEMRFLSDEEGWELFRRHSFGDGRSVAIRSGIEVVAREIARECKGLPLALKVVGAAFSNQPDVSEWELALSQMKLVDTTFYEIHPDIEEDLFKSLKWSYDALPQRLKTCFLYVAAYPEDKDIPANELIALWTAEGDLKDGDQDIGRSFLKSLRDRCLLDVSEMPFHEDMIKVHDVLRDLAIYIAEKEENCYFRAGQNVRSFPVEKVTRVGCRRISLMNNYIASLPADFDCPTLTTLLLKGNFRLQRVPESFLGGLQSLRMLDLSFTGMLSLPESLGQLKHLVFLQLRGTLIRQLPESTCSLSKLQILNLSDCKSLQSLPGNIGELRRLSCLDLHECGQLDCLPSGLLQLTGLKTLSIEPKSSVIGEEMGSFTRMTELRLGLRHIRRSLLPKGMEAMVAIQRLTLESCRVTRLPAYICKYKQLSELCLFDCEDLEELPQLHTLPSLKILKIRYNSALMELGHGFGSAKGFPRLEELELAGMKSLKSLVGRCSDGSGGVLEEGAMPMLTCLTVFGCPNLRRLPVGMERLGRLEQIRTNTDWWNGLIWEDQTMKDRLQTKYLDGETPYLMSLMPYETLNHSFLLEYGMDCDV